MANEKSPIDRVLDAAVFAPLGFLLTRDETLETLAAAGRRQIAFSRSLGRAALKGIARGTQASHRRQSEPVSAQKGNDVATVEDDGRVEGFSDMTARELITFIASCSDTQAAFIRSSEVAGKNRVTVIRALDARD